MLDIQKLTFKSPIILLESQKLKLKSPMIMLEIQKLRLKSPIMMIIKLHYLQFSGKCYAKCYSHTPSITESY